ncbi:hypothetical protein QUF61_02920 [Candidatus Venteria ishoeyi]|uniref:hypothetical protein n=1 Tax=Candidatus Venteria ishoeyi TaxID=1899563 RepID=UPI0025A57A42|nr:hypothetical protein [Candidatus Venteria ishoeyi]MDM8545424.1 hypothetical protein [Candidatus Venteria ishoeyi]
MTKAKTGAQAAYVTVFITQEMEKKTSQVAEVIKFSLLRNTHEAIAASLTGLCLKDLQNKLAGILVNDSPNKS